MSFADREGFIWLDGKMIPWKDAKVHVLTHTLHYGLGVFEGVRAYDSELGAAIFRLDNHTKRLLNSAKILNMTLPYSHEELNSVQKQVMRENGLKSGYIRPMCFYGSESMGLHASGLQVHVMVAAWEWGAYLGEDNLRRGIRVKTSSFSRHHANVTMCKAKSNGNYINSMLALQEAINEGYDEAMLLDVDGYVAEGSGENIFIVRNGVIYTPDLTSALEGITRDAVIVLAKDLGYEVVEKRITRDEVYIADEAFFTGTAAEVVPIREIDKRQIGEGACGPVTRQIQACFFDAVHGRNQAYLHWLTPVAE